MESLVYFKALSDESRIRLVNILLRHDLRVGELVSVLEMGQSRVSRHLKILADAGLARYLKDGVWGVYSIAESGPARTFINAVRYLFENDPVLENDLKRARALIESRSSATLRFFDHIAPGWDMLKREILGSFDLGRAIFKDAGKYGVGVDLGCGTGELLDIMKDHAGTAIGVDSSPRMLQEARKRFSAAGGKNVEIRLGEIEHLPLGDNEADLAVISLVLHYLEEPVRAVAEVARVLKAGGDFVLAEFAPHENRSLKSVYGVKWLGFDPAAVRSWLEKNAFRVNRVESHGLDKGPAVNIFRATLTG